MKYQLVFGAISILLLLAVIDNVLAVGFFVLALLASAALLTFRALGLENKKIYLLFGLALMVHVAMVVFIHLAGFQPFNGGDYVLYDEIAKIISGRLHNGDFSIGNTGLGSWYPVIVGYIYALFGTEMFFGQMLNAWAAALASVIIYLIVLQTGRSENESFWVGAISIAYPSFIFFGSSMLKESLVVLLAMFSLLMALKLIKNFSWPKFFVLYTTSILLTNLRFYVSFAVILAFIFCWFLFSELERRKRIFYGIFMLLVLGFIPQITGYGYMGVGNIDIVMMDIKMNGIAKELLNPAKIIFYREKVYAPLVEGSNVIDNSMRGAGSSFVIKTNFNNPFSFIINNCLAFIYVVLGPFPWQLNHLRQLLVLPEMLAWYFLLFFIIKGIFGSIKQHYKIILPLVIFSVLIFGVQALYASNFGIIVRIRMPAFLALLCLLPLGLKKLSNIKFLKNVL